MQEIKIPEGHKATILGGIIRIEPIEVKRDFIKVPESIGIYRLKDKFMRDFDNGDRLYIGFNDTQALGFADGKYRVDVRYPSEFHDWFEKVQCFLQPCKREDLKSGDTVFISRANNFCRHDMYYKKIDESEYGFVRVFDDGVRQVDIKSDDNIRFYKLIPING